MRDITSNNVSINHENIESRLTGILGWARIFLGSHAEASNILQKNMTSLIWDGKRYINLIISTQFLAINNFQ